MREPWLPRMELLPGSSSTWEFFREGRQRGPYGKVQNPGLGTAQPKKANSILNYLWNVANIVDCFVFVFRRTTYWEERDGK